jgi:hypothetical protein
VELQEVTVHTEVHHSTTITIAQSTKIAKKIKRRDGSSNGKE